MRAGSRSGTVAPEHELARLLSSTASRRAELATRIADLAQSVDGARLSTFANAQRIGPLLAARLVDAARESDSAWTDWWLGAEQHAKNALLHGAALKQIATRLEAAGIPALPLKGAVLAEQLYGDPALRCYGDVDVLVARQQLAESRRILQTLGYVERTDVEPSSLHVALEQSSGVLPPIDLHWRVHWLEDAFSSDLLERSSIRDGVRVAEPHDQLVSLLLFYVRDGFQGLRLAADVAACWDLLAADGRPGALAKYLLRYPALERALTASALVAEQVVGLPGRQLLGLDVGGVRRRVAVAIRLADWQLRGERDQAAADVSLVDGLCAPPGGLRAFARRYLLCDLPRIADIYDVPVSATARARVLQAFHPFKLATRYALALRTTGLSRNVFIMDADVQLAAWGKLQASGAQETGGRRV